MGLYVIRFISICHISIWLGMCISRSSKRNETGEEEGEGEGKGEEVDEGKGEAKKK